MTAARIPLALRGSAVQSSILNPQSSILQDGFGRVHTNLRVSVTDRCNLRCTYCMDEDVTFLPRSELLSFEEIERVVRAAALFGVDKVRLTGGEPLVRRDLPTLVRLVSAVPGITDVGLTTNGILLADQAKPLFDAGLRRLNVSLDTLDPGRFRQLARRDGLDAVLAGLDAAKAAGFAPIKVNAVAIRGFVELDAVPLARYCRMNGFELRFIESMPIGAGDWGPAQFVAADELIGLLSDGVSPLVPATRDPHAPATDYDYADGGGRVGVIASVSQSFCGTCNRLRLTADGKLRNCLFSLDETDVKELLRDGGPDERLGDALRACVAAKWAGHGINSTAYQKPRRTMHAIGG